MQAKKHIATAIILLALIGTASATEYYVDAASGNDSNPGTEAQPWLTFQRALPNWGGGGTLVAQGDTVHVASGDYGAVNYNENGDTGRTDWITYIGDSNKNSIIRQLQIRYTTNAYMKFYNFSIYEATNPPEFDRSLNIVGTNATTNRANKIEFYNCYIRAAPVQAGLRAIWIMYADDIVLEDCEIDGGFIGLMVALSVTNLKVTNCHFHDQWGDVIDLYGTQDGTSVDNVTFDGCLFEDLIWLDGMTPPGAHLDYVQTSGNNNTGDAVNDIIFRNNTFKFDSTTVGQGGLMIQAHGTGFTFENNLLYGTAIGSGFQTPIKVAGKVLDNVIVRNNTFAVVSTENYRVVISIKITGLQNYNNIYRTGFSITVDPGEATQGNNIYNSYLNKGGGVIGPDMAPSSIVLGQAGVEALFEDFANNDFHLKGGSIAIDFGSAAHATTTDIEGNPRDNLPDAGAYEFQGVTPCTNGIKDIGERGVDCGAVCGNSCTFYVSPTGSDSADGTITEPWQTLAKAAAIAEAGDTVLVRAGVYNETLTPQNSGTAGNLITFKAYSGEECQGKYAGTKSNCQVVIDGQGLGTNGVDLGTNSYSRIEGFEIRNWGWGGISVSSANNIEIVNNYIHSNGITDASGFVAWNTNNMLIENNEFYNNSAHGMLIWGDIGCSNVIIRGNNIHYNGEDAMMIGWAPDATYENYIVEDNVLYDQFHTALHQDGINFSNGKNLVIRNNIVYDFTQLIYIPVGALTERAVLEDVEIYGNVLYTDRYWTVSSGEAPAISIDARSADNTIVKNISIHSNTIGWVGNPPYGAIWILGNSLAEVTNINIRDNIFYDAGMLISIPSINEVNSNYNLFFGSSPESYEGTNSFVADPQFVNYERHISHDFRLQSTSHAIDAGDPNLASVVPLPTPFVDLEGTTRPQGTTYDIGAYEFQGTECVDTPALLNYISQWKQAQITMLTLMGKIGLWKSGAGCP